MGNGVEVENALEFYFSVDTKNVFFSEVKGAAEEKKKEVKLIQNVFENTRQLLKIDCKNIRIILDQIKQRKNNIQNEVIYFS